jgi:long-chain acyl-CoA synthetase
MISRDFGVHNNLSRRMRMKDMEPPRIERLFSDYVKEYAACMPKKTAINFYGREITYRELDESSDRLAAAFADMGYKRGDRIGLFLQPCPQCIISYLTAMKMGLVSVPIDPMSKELELEYFLNDSGAKIIVAMDTTYPVVLLVKNKCKIQDTIITSFHDYLPDAPSFPVHDMMKPEKKVYDGTHELLWLLKKYDPKPSKVEVLLSDNGFILYTGGTTGLPKGCVHTHQDLMYVAWGQSELTYNRVTKDDTFLNCWPLTHISGIAHSMAPALFTGATLIQLARWDPSAAMQALDKYRVTLISWVVPCYFDVLNHPDVENYKLTSLRVSLIVPFVTPITDEVVNRWEERTKCRVYDLGYGSSEVMNFCSYGYGLPFPRPQCVVWGRPFPGVEVKIKDFDTGKELPEGQIGEIVVNTPSQLKEYLNKQEETKKHIIDGWVHMQDRGYVKDGVLYFLGKISEVVKVSGYTVALKEIEMFGMKNPAIDKIAVIGVPHPKKGNQIKAFVVLKPGAKESATDIEAWFKEKLAVFKRPVVELRKELPLSGKGEILKRELVKGEIEKDD